MNEIGQYITGITVAVGTLGGVVYGATQWLKEQYGMSGNGVKLFPLVFSMLIGLLIAFATSPEGAMTLRQVGLTTLQGVLSGILITLASFGFHSGFKNAEKVVGE